VRYDRGGDPVGIRALSRSLLAFLLFLLVLAVGGAALVAWYAGPTAAAVAFDIDRREAPYFLLHLVPTGRPADGAAVEAHRAGFLAAASADGGTRIWSAGTARRHEARSRHGSYRGSMAAVEAYGFARGANLLQLLTGKEFRTLAAEPALPMLLAGTDTPPAALDPGAVAVLALYEVDGGNLAQPLGAPDAPGWLVALGAHDGKLAWDAPLDWIRGREQWNRVLLLQFPDARAAGAWLRDPATLTARALASRDLGDLLVLVSVPEG
jgi:hypothetical protein